MVSKTMSSSFPTQLTAAGYPRKHAHEPVQELQRHSKSPLNGLSLSRLAVVDLVPLLAALVRPREMQDRNHEEGVGRVGHTRESVVPSQEGGQVPEDAACEEEAGLWRGAAFDWEEVGEAEAQEGEVEGEEEEEEGHGRSQGTNQQERGEDEPALKQRVSSRSHQFEAGHASRTHHQVEAERCQERRGAGRFEIGDDVEASRRQDDRRADPESTVRGQRGRTEGVTDGHFPAQRVR